MAVKLDFCRSLVKGGVLALLAAVVQGCASPGMHEIDAGPLYTADHDLDGTARVRVLGPLVETQQRDDGRKFVAVRPFYSKVSDPANERSVANVLWPLGMVKELRGERDWVFFPALGHNFDTQDSKPRSRWSVFPILFGGRDINDERYFCVFPLGGTLHEFFGADRITFVLFPLYSYTEHDDNRIWRVLWPIFVYSKGNDEFRFRVFPFYGVSVNDKRWKKRFVMWPFWTSVKYLYPDQPGGGFILFPLFGKIDIGNYYSRMILPPLFKWEVGSHNHRALNCPWPFIRYKSGDVKMLYLWPLWGRKNTLGIDRQWFVLWPLISGKKTLQPEYVIRNFRALPFFFYESRTERIADKQAAEKHGPSAILSALSEDAAERGRKAAESGHEGKVFERYFKIWPVFSYLRQRNVSRLRILALWPMKNTPAVERNWAPLWSLFTWRRQGSEVESELLWGLLRWGHGESARRLSVFPVLQTKTDLDADGVATGRKWSLFYGLLGYERKGLQKQFKMLYFLKFGRLERER